MTDSIFGISRPSLFWAIDSILPHVGAESKNLAFVGMRFSDDLRVYASDGYTAAVSSVTATGDSESVGWHLHPTEAKELLRFVKPSRVGHNSHTVTLIVDHLELHVGIYDPDGVLQESTMFELLPPGLVGFKDVWGLIQRVAGSVRANRLPPVLSPDLLKRLAKAERDPADRMRFYPSYSEKYGSVLVTVGQDFICAVAGMSWDEVTLPKTLAQWGLLLQKESAA